MGSVEYWRRETVPLRPIGYAIDFPETALERRSTRDMTARVQLSRLSRLPNLVPSGVRSDSTDDEGRDFFTARLDTVSAALVSAKSQREECSNVREHWFDNSGQRPKLTTRPGRPRIALSAVGIDRKRQGSVFAGTCVADRRRTHEQPRRDATTRDTPNGFDEFPTTAGIKLSVRSKKNKRKKVNQGKEER